MSGFKVNFSVNNQLATPSIHAAALANRPAAGQVGRLFVDTDNPSTGMYRDTGTTWIKIAAPSSPEADTLQTVTDRGNTTTQSITVGAATVPVATVDVRRTTASLNGASDWAIASVNSPTIPAGASFGVNFVNAVNGSQSLTFAGNATIGNTGLNSAGMFINTLGSSGAGTVTVGQSTTIRTLAAIHSGVYFNTAAATTFSHVANIKTIVPINSGAAAATVTNYYGVLVSDSTPSSGAITFTNRWGIYQEGASDRNAFFGNTAIGTDTFVPVVGTFLQVTDRNNGDAKIVINRTNSTINARWDIYIPPTTNALRFYNSNLGDALQFQNSGRVLIGTTTDAGNYLLQVNGDALINSITVGRGGGSVASNTAFGFEAINASATGTFNTVLGYTAGRSLTSGYENTFVGYNAGRSNTTGYNNVSVGGGSGFRITTGALNTNVGQGAGDANVVGNGNVNIGYQAGFFGTSDYNINIGTYAGRTITTGQYNIMMGFYTGQSITTGNYNTIIGHNVTGLSASLSNTIILADGQGNQRIYVNNSGNTGIGTTSPAAKLHLNGTLRIDGQSSGTAGGASGQHLIINLDGTTYKIALLNP